MRLRLLILLMLAACGDDGSSSADESSTSSMPTTTMVSGSSSSASGSGTGSGSTGTPTTDDPTTSGAPGGSSTTGEPPSTATSTGSTDTGATGAGVYAAVAVPGGLDRIRITKRDDDAGTCTWVVLVTPAMMSPFPVTVTDPWTIQEIAINDVPEACDSQNPAMFGIEVPFSASGSVDLFDMGVAFPCTLDVNISADYNPVALDVPDTDALVATDINIAGGC